MPGSGTPDYSLHNIHKMIVWDGVSLQLCNPYPQIRLHGLIQHMTGNVIGLSMDVSSHILGLMKIPHLEYVALMVPQVQTGRMRDLERAVKIINKHLEGDRNIHECQEEMIEAGLSEYARL